jgi:hypothetical protein
VIAAGHQPNYLPWLGFFDKMAKCDVFVIEDDVQFERQGFTNRNKIKSVSGAKWLSVPIKHVGKDLLINEVEINNLAEKDWSNRHWLTLMHNYSKAPYWEKYSSFFEETYSQKWDMLIDLNMHFIELFRSFLDIKTSMIFSSSLGASGIKDELILAQCKLLRADTQLSGSGALSYMNKKRFIDEGINLIFQNFQYPVYTQLHGEYLANLSVVDYLFCTGGRQWMSQDKMNKDGLNNEES